MRAMTIGLVALTLAATCHAQDQYDIRVYPCPRAEGAITIDGMLDEAAWRRAPLSGGFTYYNRPELIEPQTAVRVLWDEEYIYFGVVCAEPNLGKLSQVGHARDSREVFHGETIEIFVDPDHDQRLYYQFGINAAASIYDSVRTDPSWSAHVRAATTIGEGAWTLEVAIPWADMGAAPEVGQVVGFNVCRDRYLGADKQWSNWAQTAANFHDPERFGHAVLSPDAARLGALEAEYRKGGRIGAIVFEGPPALVDAAYRMLARHSIADGDALLTQVAEAFADDRQEGASDELARRIAGYRAELTGFAEQIDGGQPLGLDTWKQMTARLAGMRAELDGVIWEARLAALISTI